MPNWIFLFAGLWLVSYLAGRLLKRIFDTGWDLVGFVTWCIAAVLCAGSVGYAQHEAIYTPRVDRSLAIYSVERDARIEGHFTLGSGSINSKPVYFFYKERGGGFVLTQVDCDKTTIFERDNATPHIELVHQYSTYAPQRWLYGHWLGMQAEDRYADYHWNIIVPRGTIRRQFSL